MWGQVKYGEEWTKCIWEVEEEERKKKEKEDKCWDEDWRLTLSWPKKQFESL